MYSSVFSHQGVREQNEDTIFPAPGQPPGSLFIVADGLGGHADGKAASELAVSSLQQILEKEDPAVFVLGGHRMEEQELMEAFLSDAVRQAAAAVRHTARQRGSDMGSTLLAVLIRNGRGYCAHVGDCALFVTEDGELPPTKRTTEHRRGASLTRSLGAADQVTPDVFSFQFGAASALVMGCDGFWEHVPASQIGQLLDQLPAACAAAELGQAALDAGSQDNVSVLVAAGDDFVRPRAARQAAAYQELLAQRPDGPETAARRQELAAFIAGLAQGGAPAAPAAPGLAEAERQALQQQVDTLTAQLQAQLDQNLKLQSGLEQAQAAAAGQAHAAHQDFVIKDLETQLSEARLREAGLREQIDAAKTAASQHNATASQELELARQKGDALERQLQKEQQRLGGADESFRKFQQQIQERDVKLHELHQQLQDKDVQLRKMQQKLMLSEQLTDAPKLDALSRDLLNEDAKNMLSAAIYFARKLEGIYLRYPDQVTDVVKIQSFYPNLKKWLETYDKK